ncbi:MAG TPA: hypothetical protein VFJ52_03380 [Terriglobia bacterium]|nr:hypothetical protein [Terriglobia bacterium]
MRLSVKGLALAIGILWGGGILLVGIVNLVSPSYGVTFLQMASSIYPGFHNSHHFLDVLVGTGYGLIDGGIGGAILALLYNCFAGAAKQAS